MAILSKQARQWFRVENVAKDASVAEIHIVDFIGDWFDDAMNRFFGESIGVTARAFVEELAKLPESVKAIHLHINSPGGDVQAGINIANALREQQTKGRVVETFIDGIAASIASVIAMAGSKVHIGDNALLMTHNPMSVAIGNAAEMRKVADILDTIRGQIVNTYKWHSDLSEDAILALMDAETWMDADEAIANGFATDKVEGLKAAASIDPRAVAKLTVPDKFRARFDALVAKPAQPEQKPVAAAAAEVLRVCREADCLEMAEALISENATTDQVTARVTAARDAKQAATARAIEIRAICEKAKHPDLAESFITGGMAVDQVRANLTIVTAKLDRADIDTGLNPDTGTRAKARINTAAVYAQRNRFTPTKEQ